MPSDAVDRALDHLERHLERRVTLDELARVAGLSPFHLQRSFKRRTGLTPREYVSAVRLARFKQRVRAGDSVAEATYDAGFGSSRGLYEAAGPGLGMTPGRYARGGAGMAVRHACAACSLGRVLIGATDTGVCAVFLGDDDQALLEALRAELPRAELAPGDGGPWLAAVLEHLDGAPAPRAVPLELAGTPFQLRVWRALRDIPAGETRSYSEVAAALGEPRAARAVARACAANAVAVLVPCHRVVRANGDTGGYRWGAGRKRALLEREVRSAPNQSAPKQ